MQQLTKTEVAELAKECDTTESEIRRIEALVDESVKNGGPQVPTMPEIREELR